MATTTFCPSLDVPQQASVPVGSGGRGRAAQVPPPAAHEADDQHQVRCRVAPHAAALGAHPIRHATAACRAAAQAHRRRRIRHPVEAEKDVQTGTFSAAGRKGYQSERYHAAKPQQLEDPHRGHTADAALATLSQQVQGQGLPAIDDTACTVKCALKWSQHRNAAHRPCILDLDSILGTK